MQTANTLMKENVNVVDERANNDDEFENIYCRDFTTQTEPTSDNENVNAIHSGEGASPGSGTLTPNYLKRNKSDVYN